MKEIKISQFDPAKYLNDDESQQEYLKLSIESGDEKELIEALNTIARAKGISQLAKDTGLGRESLYKTLSGNVEPKLSTLQRIAAGLGFELTLTLTPRNF